MNFNDTFSLPNYQILPLCFLYKLDINVCQVNVIKNKINLLLKMKIFIFSPTMSLFKMAFLLHIMLRKEIISNLFHLKLEIH